MNTLDYTIKSNGTTYTQIDRKGNIALYQSPNRGFEVIKVRTREERTIGNSTIAAGEYYPSTSEWGRYGLSATTEAYARALFDREVDNEKAGLPFNPTEAYLQREAKKAQA